MKKEFAINSAKFVYSKNELGYQDIIDNMPDAKEITIITYNISEKQSHLIKCIQSAPHNCEINIITNIPSRWDKYYGSNFRENARKKINLYMTKLAPEKLGKAASVFFDFSNHGKIIMTDSIAYIGSENYSEESANNTEFGFISREKDFIEFIKEELLHEVKKEAVPYYQYNYTSLLLEANMILSAVFNIKNCLYEETHRLHDDIDGEWFYYLNTESDLTIHTLESIRGITESACKIAGDIYDAIDDITNGDEDEAIKANDILENLIQQSRRIEEITTFDTLYDFAQFDTIDFINHQLQGEYAMEAYEENLENCINLALEEAMCTVMDLAQDAHDDINDLLKQLKEFKSKYSGFIDIFKEYGVKKINPEIDNT